MLLWGMKWVFVDLRRLVLADQIWHQMLNETEGPVKYYECGHLDRLKMVYGKVILHY